jgi:hypothetical protein
MNRSQPAADDLDVSQEIQSKFGLAFSSRASRSGAERAIKWLTQFFNDAENDRLNKK